MLHHLRCSSLVHHSLPKGPIGGWDRWDCLLLICGLGPTSLADIFQLSCLPPALLFNFNNNIYKGRPVFPWEQIVEAIVVAFKAIVSPVDKIPVISIFVTYVPTLQNG